MKKTRILLADDHLFLRMGLNTMLGDHRDMCVVGEAANGREAIELARKLKPDIVIMDLMMPELGGAAATRLLHDEMPHVRILILTTFGTANEMSEALRNGASGALTKDVSADELITAIRRIVAGETVITAGLSEKEAEANGSRKPTMLGERQREILAFVARGFTNADIARRFNLSEITVKKHLSAIFEKLGVANRSEAVSTALREHLLKI